MKLIIAAATGFVGQEILRQALRNPHITSIVTLGRRPITLSPEVDENRDKVTDIVREDGEDYSPDVIDKIKDADACIWTIAVLPGNSKITSSDEMKKVTRDYPLAAISALPKSNKTGKALRFIYFSGIAISRDLTQDFEAYKSFVSPEYFKLRCTLEIELVEFAEKSEGEVEVCCVRPGHIEAPGMTDYSVRAVPTIEREEVVAACLKQCIDGIEKDPLGNDDLIRIGKEALVLYA